MTLSITLSKGYLFPQSLDLLKKSGYDISGLSEENRRLTFFKEKDGIRYIVARPTDVPKYVEYGAADLGIVGKDVLMEQQSHIYELLDLEFGQCRLITAALAGTREQIERNYEHLGYLRVATKYPRVAEEYFNEKGIQVEIIRLHGSIELAPILGIADQIVDITSSGRTLRENNLQVIDEIALCTARLIANQVSYKLKYQEIDGLISRVKKAMGKEAVEGES
jgi:ATP phosphoribosyltransferase